MGKKNVSRAVLTVALAASAVIIISLLLFWTSRLREKRKVEELRLELEKVIRTGGEEALLSLAGVPLKGIFYDDDEVILFEDTQSWDYSLEEMQNMRAFDRVKNSIVEIVADRTLSTSVSGCGVVISSEGYVITNGHVIGSGKDFSVNLYTGETVSAVLIGVDSLTDIAVIKLEKTERKYVPIEMYDGALRTGQKAIAVGSPYGYSWSESVGIVSGLNRLVYTSSMMPLSNMIQTDAAINPGNSGGPLINMRGEVIGVTSAKTVTASYDENGNAISAEGLGFALPIDDVLSVVVQLVTEGKVQRPGIGLTSIYLDEATAQQYQRPSGILIVSVLADAPACNAGIRADDILVECNGIKLTGNDMFGEIVRSFKIGDSMPVKYWRNGEYLTTNIIIGDLNQMGDTIYNNETGGDWLE